METKYTTFHQQLKYNISRSFLMMLILTISLFSIGFVSYSYYNGERRARDFGEEISEKYKYTYHEYANQLYKMAADNNTLNVINQIDSPENLLYEYYQFNRDLEIKADLILMNQNKEIVLTTLNQDIMNQHFTNYLKVICDNSLPSEITTSLYFLENNGRYIMCYSLNQVNQDVGYILMMMDDDDWKGMLNTSQIDAVIVDRLNNVISASKNEFIQRNNKFRIDMEQKVFELRNHQYRVSEKKLNGYGVTIYTFASIDHLPKTILFGVILIIVSGLGLFIVSIRFTNQLADKNSASMNQLMHEMEKIKKDIHHQVQINSEDEFSMLADGINTLIYEINSLHEKNNELDRLRRQSEIKQLEAQFNPHFIYNTLDVIRYTIIIEPKIASDLILKLTELLRYSINNNMDMVHFGEDMDFTYKFLKIQKYRYDKRFNYKIDVDLACMDIIVPKLMLQPLIENSIKYGFEKKSSLNVKIEGRVENNSLIVIVEDDGDGLDENEVRAINKHLRSEINEGNHHGLYNLARRLYLTYGKHSTLTIESVKGQYMRVVLRICMEENDHV